MAQINCVVVTPERTSLDELCEFVAVPLFDGELGVAPGRAPLIGRLGFGELRLRNGGKVDRYFVDGGFVQVSDNVVSVLTSRAVPVAQLDRAAAEQQLNEALRMPMLSDEDSQKRDRAIHQARAVLRLATK